MIDFTLEELEFMRDVFNMSIEFDNNAHMTDERWQMLKKVTDKTYQAINEKEKTK